MAQIIYVSKAGNAKGQTLFAAHLATILAENKKTALVDFHPQNHLLEMFVAKRHHFNLKEKQKLPVPAYVAYQKSTFAETASKYGFSVLDCSDPSLLKEADILITLVSEPAVALELANQKSDISTAIWNAKKSRAAKGKNAFKHIILPTISFDKQTTQKLQKAAQQMGYAIAPVLEQNKAYAEGLLEGIGVLDKNLPFFKNNFNEADFFARRNLKQILEFIFADK